MTPTDFSHDLPSATAVYDCAENYGCTEIDNYKEKIIEVVLTRAGEGFTDADFYLNEFGVDFSRIIRDELIDWIISNGYQVFWHYTDYIDPPPISGAITVSWANH